MTFNCSQSASRNASSGLRLVKPPGDRPDPKHLRSNSHPIPQTCSTKDERGNESPSRRPLHAFGPHHLTAKSTPKNWGIPCWRRGFHDCADQQGRSQIMTRDIMQCHRYSAQRYDGLDYLRDFLVLGAAWQPRRGCVFLDYVLGLALAEVDRLPRANVSADVSQLTVMCRSGSRTHRPRER